MPLASEWKANNGAVIKEFAPGTTTGPCITLWHPSYPLEGEWAANEPMAPPKHIPRIVGKYLGRIAAAFGLPSDLLADDWTFNYRATGLQLTWLPIAPPPQAATVPVDPRHSVWTRRYADALDPSTLVDRTAVFLAVQSHTENDPTTALGSRLGIRVIAHVSSSAAGPWTVRITGATCSTALRAALAPGSVTITALSPFFSDFSSPQFREQLTKVANLGQGYVPRIDGIRLLPPVGQNTVLNLFVNMARPESNPSALSYAFTFRVSKNLTVNPVAPPMIESVERHALVAHAAVQPSLFRQDPASEHKIDRIVSSRPNRSPGELNAFCYPVLLPGLNDVGGSAKLDDTADHSNIEVKQSKLVDRAGDEKVTQTTVLGNCKHPRTNEFATLSAYQHARELFDRMRSCGLSPSEYFRAAALPLLVRYRSPITPGPGKDGRTVNAQVKFDPCSCDIGAYSLAALRSIQVRFALADVQRTWSRREPLGLAADPRWSWHEYGHVLLAASTGALELYFAHSAGDALAAIIADPHSKLARHKRMRGATFPWVHLNRRHDRSVWHGWSWCGTYHRQGLFPSDGDNCRHKGYQSEQILSTSLFRLYRALGGDTVKTNGKPKKKARTAAADYTAYLIMRAISLLGSAGSVPVETPAGFAGALIDADIGTVTGLGDPLGERAGGWAHKVVRWAFEAQGLYGTSDWNAVLNEPGKPPLVDIFIDNGRPDSEGSVQRGGYMPVSLDWKSSSPPEWQAAGHIRVSGKNVDVDVRDRGPSDVTGVKVDVWYAERAASDVKAPHWNSKKADGSPSWTAFSGTVASKTVRAWPAAATTFGPFQLPSATKRYWVLASASCADDLANIDAATLLPCAQAVMPVMPLVAGDNNLGLVKVR